MIMPCTQRMLLSFIKYKYNSLVTIKKNELINNDFIKPLNLFQYTLFKLTSKGSFAAHASLI